jgi:hypothetical protein
MGRFSLRRPSPALVISIVALVVAMGGTSYGAFALPRNSVGTKQLRNGAVTTRKLANGAVTKAKLNLRGVTVPNALHAASATSATSAGSAGLATLAAGASSLRGVTIVRYAGPSGFGISNPAGTQTHGVANCPAGLNAISGGSFSTSPNPGVNVNSSYPTRQSASDPEPDAWAVDMNNNSGAAALFAVYVVCAPVGMTSNYTAFAAHK